MSSEIEVRPRRGCGEIGTRSGRDRDEIGTRSHLAQEERIGDESLFLQCAAGGGARVPLGEGGPQVELALAEGGVKEVLRLMLKRVEVKGYAAERGTLELSLRIRDRGGAQRGWVA